MFLIRVFSALLFLFCVIFTIPLAFDVGGRTCGLAFSLALSTFYFLYSSLRLSTPQESRFRYVLVKLFQASQWIVIPTLMIWSLNKFSVDSDNSSGWVERTFGGKTAQDPSVREWLFGREGLVETVTIGGWDKLLRWSTPVFQMSEGFCSLLVIQAAGQITRYMVNGEGGDGWMIFTDYQPTQPKATLPHPEPSFPPLPPILMASYSTLIHVLSTLPSTLHSASNFLIAAIMTITPSVIISLAYRLFVMYASARIIPAVRESGARALSQEPSLEDSDGVGQVLGFLSYYSPSILIAVYTSLLMQHFASASADHPGEWWTSQGGDAGGNVWRWANLAGTMALYAVELYLGKANDERGLTSHWKIE
ncbi:hypothetical protein LTR66_000133 [Elasticomyces elasticus]|nr:hypothetical protein LTR50_005281 [Elasticomyces elasticus]KAK5001095.1 hypothetical protein LTR66_000133 [Elasticomyces elasticus]